MASGVGARAQQVMTKDMANGKVQYKEGWDTDINDMDAAEDPPRVYINHGDGHLDGGVGFTRSIGDSMLRRFCTADESVGVFFGVDQCGESDKLRTRDRHRARRDASAACRGRRSARHTLARPCSRLEDFQQCARLARVFLASLGS